MAPKRGSTDFFRSLLRVERDRSIRVMGTAAFGAFRPLWRSPAIVSFLNP
jgi:hypothetical protein